jgi:hypothetical protein
VRIAIPSLVSALVAVLTPPSAGAATEPTLRVVPGSTLAVHASGFVPRTVVRLRVMSSGKVLRVVFVRAGVAGGFTARLQLTPACGVIVVSAMGTRDRRAHVATGVARLCPPPPPIR